MNFLNLWFITTLKRIEMASDKLSRLKSTIGRLGTLTRDVWRCHGCCMTDLGNQTWGGLDIGYRKAWHCLLHVSYIIAFLKMYQNCIISWLDCLHYWKTHLMSLPYMFYQQCSHHFQRKQVTPTWRYTGRTAGACRSSSMVSGPPSTPSPRVVSSTAAWAPSPLSSQERNNRKGKSALRKGLFLLG